MANWHLREAVEADYPRLVAISNQTALSPTTVRELNERTELRRQEGPFLRLIAEDGAGQTLGHAGVWRHIWKPEGTFFLSGAVDESAAGQGLGGALLAAIEAQVREWDGRWLITMARDDRPGHLQFLEHRGFVITDHYFRSVLAVEGFDPAPFRPALAGAEAAGYRFISMADVDPDEGRRRLYELDLDCARDEPGLEGSTPPISLEEYSRQMFPESSYDPAGIFVAVKGDEWCGISGLHFPPDTEEAYTVFTGVRRAHRGKRLAQALKLLATEHCRQRGYKRIGTGNHETNGPMLAVNRKFGFQPKPGGYDLKKSL